MLHNRSKWKEIFLVDLSHVVVENICNLNVIHKVCVCVCVCRPQRASMSSALDTYCMRWRTADHQTASPWTSTPLSPTQLWVCLCTHTPHTHTHIIYMRTAPLVPPFCLQSVCTAVCFCFFNFYLCVCSVSVLQSILSTEACKSGMPTVSELIQTPWVSLQNPVCVQFDTVVVRLCVCVCLFTPHIFHKFSFMLSSALQTETMTAGRSNCTCVNELN